MSYKIPHTPFVKFLACVIACLAPLVSHASLDEKLSDREMEVAMRMIGDEVLRCAGDHTSRVLPIQKVDNKEGAESYLVSFENEFAFDPEEIISSVEEIMLQYKLRSDLLVEVINCENKEVVHSFVNRKSIDPNFSPCSGRPYPLDCYELVITAIEDLDHDANGELIPTIKPENGKALPLKSALMIVSLFVVSGVVGLMTRKRNTEDSDPDLSQIGDTKFDKRNMTLTHDDQAIQLSHKETELLALLYTNANNPVEREIILKQVWGDEGDYVGRTLDVFISKLRKKLEPDQSVKIVNIRGIGYKLVLS